MIKAALQRKVNDVVAAENLGKEELNSNMRSIVNQADVSSNLRQAILDSTVSSLPSRPVIVVCGSAFIMAEARAELGIREPRDGDILGTASAELAVNNGSEIEEFSDSQVN